MSTETEPLCCDLSPIHDDPGTPHPTDHLPSHDTRANIVSEQHAEDHNELHHSAGHDPVRWSVAQRNVADLADPPKLTGSHREMRTWSAGLPGSCPAEWCNSLWSSACCSLTMLARVSCDGK